MAVPVIHHQVLQLLACFSQTGSLRVILDMAVLQVVHPLLKRCGGHLVEFVHADDEVFGEQFLGRLHANHTFLLHVDAQRVFRMDTRKLAHAVIQIVGTLPQIEIDNADGIHLLDVAVGAPQLDVLRNGFRRSVKNPLQIVQLARQLNLYDKYLAAVVLRLDVHTVVLVVDGVLVSLALQEFHYVHRLAEQHRDEPFKHTKIGLVAKHPLHGPVESYVFVISVHVRLLSFPMQK